MDYAFGVYLKSHCYAQGHLDFIVCYLLGFFLFCVLRLDLGSILYGFLQWMQGLCLDFFFLHRCLVIPASDIKKSTLFPLYYLCSLPKINWLLFIWVYLWASWASQVALVVKNSPTNRGDPKDLGSIPESERSPGGGHGTPLQYSCLENPMDRGAWQATVHRVAKSWTWLKRLCMHTHMGFLFCFTDLFVSSFTGINLSWLLLLSAAAAKSH